MNSKMIIAGRVLTPEGIIESGVLRIADGIIHSVEERGLFQGTIDLDVGENLIAPGFIDIHVHGAVGHSLMSSGSSGIIKALQYHLKHGTTSILPTIAAAPKEKICDSLKAISEVMKMQVQNDGGALGATIVGTHVEGPYLNAKKAGAQNPEWVRNPDLEEYQEWETLAPIRMVTIAPELAGMEQLIKYMRSKGSVLISAGHTDATFAEMKRSLEWGVSHCTHLGNGMRGLHHREPGVLGAGLIEPGLTVEIIADGFHLHPEMIKLVYRIKGADHMALITDASSYCGMPDGIYPDTECKREIIVNNGSVRIKSDNGLAGSSLTMNRAAKQMAKCGAPLVDVWKMASAVPARLIGLGDRKGQIKPGMDADLIVVNRNFDVLHTIVQGTARKWDI